MPDATKEVIQSYYKTYKIDEIDDSLKVELKNECDIDIETCLECGKCTGGCSNAHIFDMTPRKIIKLINLGEEDQLYRLDSLWTCVACHLCVDRCPAGIDIPRIIDYTREKAVKEKIKPTRDDVLMFHELMLDSINKTGRIAETFLMLKFNLKRGLYFKDATLGQKMFFKGKLKLLSPKVKDIGQVRRIFNKDSEKGEG